MTSSNLSMPAASRQTGWQKHVLSRNAFPNLQDAFNRAHDLLEDRTTAEIAAVGNLIEALAEDPNFDLESLGDSVIDTEFALHERYAVLSIVLVMASIRTQNIPPSREALVASHLAEFEEIDMNDDSPLSAALVSLNRAIRNEFLPKMADAYEPFRSSLYSSRYPVASVSAMGALRSVDIAEQLIATADARATEQEKRQNASAKANDLRHERNRRAREYVCKDWLSKPDRWPSAPKAAEYYVTSQSSLAFGMKPRTVATWIRNCAKKNGVALR